MALINRERMAGPARSPQGQQQGPVGGEQPQAGAYRHNAPQMARVQAQGMPQQPPQSQGPQVPPPPQPQQEFNTRLPQDQGEPNVNSIFRARSMQQAFVAAGQEIQKTFKIDRKFVDLKKFSGVATD